ncbi:MAG: hypothetical protein JO301_10980 [Chitinophagaceae bacterium]|nr:hypothetical protein [Chitinophagaceae bacterium]
MEAVIEYLNTLSQEELCEKLAEKMELYMHYKSCLLIYGDEIPFVVQEIRAIQELIQNPQRTAAERADTNNFQKDKEREAEIPTGIE